MKDTSSDSPPPSLQLVTASGGAAYGTIGGDLHVFASRTATYRLANWTIGPAAEPACASRESMVRQLERWVRLGRRFGVRLLYGPEPVTAWLAESVATMAVGRGWKAVRALRVAMSGERPPAAHAGRLTDAAGVLLLVQAAHEWRLDELTWLFSNALFHQDGGTARVLLLAESADFWPAVRGTLANYQADVSSQAVGT